jgi:hypothetical protein
MRKLHLGKLRNMKQHGKTNLNHLKNMLRNLDLVGHSSGSLRKKKHVKISI